jgi:hypothetical protein
MDTGEVIAVCVGVAFLTFLFFSIRTGLRENVAEQAWLKELESKANAGDMESMVALGERLGAWDAQGLKWFQMAASKGSGMAQFMCANRVLSNPKESFTLFLQATQAGYEPAMAETGLRYFHGNGVLKNIAQSTEWFIKSAEKGIKHPNFESPRRTSMGLRCRRTRWKDSHGYFTLSFLAVKRPLFAVSLARVCLHGESAEP